MKRFTDQIYRREHPPERKPPDTAAYALAWKAGDDTVIERFPDRESLLQRARDLRRASVTEMRAAVVWRWTSVANGEQFVGKEFINLD